jgi:hypothetical protein
MKRTGGVLVLVLGLPSCVGNSPVETVVPKPAEMLLRVSAAGSSYEGALIFTDTDSLVMFDKKSAHRVTVRPDSSAVLEVYQGQRRSADATAKGAAKGAAVGIAVGVGEALLTVGLSKLLGIPTSTEETVKGGVLVGATSGSLAGGLKGASEGDPVWEKVTLLQLRQQICKCPDPDAPRRYPGERLIP